MPIDGYRRWKQDVAMAYIYLPVPTPEMTSFVNRWNAGRIAKNKAAYTVLRPAFMGWKKSLRRGLDFGCLRGVLANDKLYVLAHGNQVGSTRIGACRGAVPPTIAGGDWTGGTMKSYSAAELADVIQSEGLTSTFVDLRVFACGSALTPPTHGVTQSFARGLRDELHARGYLSVQVTGYGGAAYTDYDDAYFSESDRDTQHKGVAPPGKMAIRAKDTKQVF